MECSGISGRNGVENAVRAQGPFQGPPPSRGIAHRGEGPSELLLFGPAGLDACLGALGQCLCEAPRVFPEPALLARLVQGDFHGGQDLVVAQGFGDGAEGRRGLGPGGRSLSLRPVTKSAGISPASLILRAASMPSISPGRPMSMTTRSGRCSWSRPPPRTPPPRRPHSLGQRGVPPGGSPVSIRPRRAGPCSRE